MQPINPTHNQVLGLLLPQLEEIDRKILSYINNSKNLKTSAYFMDSDLKCQIVDNKEKEKYVHREAVVLAKRVNDLISPWMALLIQNKTNPLVHAFRTNARYIIQIMNLHKGLHKFIGASPKEDQDVDRAISRLHLIFDCKNPLDELEPSITDAHYAYLCQYQTSLRAEWAKNPKVNSIISFGLEQEFIQYYLREDAKDTGFLLRNATSLHFITQLSVTFWKHAKVLYNQLALTKKVSDLADVLGLNTQNYLDSSPLYTPLQLTGFGQTYLPKNVQLLYQNTKEALQNYLASIGSTNELITTDGLYKYLEPILDKFECKQDEQPFARMVVECLVLHAYTWQLRRSDKTQSAITALSTTFAKKNQFSAEVPNGNNFQNHELINLYKNAQLLQLIFSAAIGKEPPVNKFLEWINMNQHIFLAFNCKNQKILQIINKYSKLNDFSITKEEMDFYRQEISKLFLKHFSSDLVVNEVSVYKSTAFNKGCAAANKMVPSKTFQELQQIGIQAPAFFKYEGPDYFSLIKLIRANKHSLTCQIQEIIDLPQQEKLTEVECTTTTTNIALTQAPQQVFSLVEGYAPRVARWFAKSHDAIFSGDPNYANLSKDKQNEMICRHAFTKTVEMYLPTHFVAVNTVTNYGPCTAYLARGCMILNQKRHEVVIEIYTSENGVVFHRYLANPKETSIHRRADELLQNFTYEPVPDEFLNEWTVVGSGVKESESAQKVVLQDPKLKMALEIYKSSKR